MDQIRNDMDWINEIRRMKKEYQTTRASKEFMVEGLRRYAKMIEKDNCLKELPILAVIDMLYCAMDLMSEEEFDKAMKNGIQSFHLVCDKVRADESNI